MCCCLDCLQADRSRFRQGVGPKQSLFDLRGNTAVYRTRIIHSKVSCKFNLIEQKNLPIF